MHTVFYTTATCFGAIISPSSGTDTKIPLKLRAVQSVTISIHMLWYQQCGVVYRFWLKLCQLPEDGDIIAPKHEATM